LDDAADCYRKAIQLKPDFVEAHNALGRLYKDRNEFDDALVCYRRVAELRPDSSDAQGNLAYVLKQLGRFEEAVACCRRAIVLNPNQASVHSNLGNVLQEAGQLDAALDSYRHALELNPNIPDVHYNLGNVLKDLGRHDNALASFRRALEINPEYFEAQSNMLFTLNYTDHTAGYCLEVARKYGRMVSKKVSSRFSAWKCEGSPKRLRVGIVSGDLNNHPVGYFLESLLANLDPTVIELFAYPTDLKVDALTTRIRPYFSAWKPISNLNDADAARLIHTDAVHVLLDLSGHTYKNRLPVFAWKPAPIQVSWLGYFATTGVEEMDFLLADEVSVPDSQRGNFTEQIWYLPDTRLCFTPPSIELSVSPLPALKNGFVTFGCFQRLNKIGDEVLSVWREILDALPDANLRLQCKQLGDTAVLQQQLKRLQAHGIDTARVEMCGAESRMNYLERHHDIDMMLDTFPYPGGTTICEELWMGVPTLTLAGTLCSPC
jgi:predicted O-linked N-acetylglucosamine transferase (SPINDLY family)